ncbi:MAG: hypothetical protein AAFV53_26140 [Myxococcota bacterium]
MVTTARTIQEALILLRGDLEQKELAQRFADIDLPLSVSTISHMETGRRRVTGRSLAAYRKLFDLESEASERLQRLCDAQYIEQVA